MKYFDCFGGLVAEVMAQAAQEARRFYHDELRSEHVLLALTRCERGVAWQVFRVLNQNPSQIRLNLEKLLHMGSPEVILSVTHSSDLQKVFDWAYDAMKAWKHSYLTTGHLLVGILTNGGDYSVAQGVLHSLEITVEKVQGLVVKKMHELQENDAFWERFTYPVAVDTRDKAFPVVGFTSQQMAWLTQQQHVGEYSSVSEALVGLIQQSMVRDAPSLPRLVAKYDALVSRGDQQTVQEFLNSEVAQSDQEFIAMVGYEAELLKVLQQSDPIVEAWVVFLQEKLGLPLQSQTRIADHLFTSLRKLLDIRLARAKEIN